MSTKIDWEELSAYLDGESADPRGVARRIAESPEAGERFAALESVSSLVRSLPEPNVSPAFATRVMAEVAESRGMARGWFGRHGLAVKAACVVLTVAIGVLVWPPPRLGEDVAVNEGGDEALWAALEMQIAASEESEEWIASRLLFGEDVAEDGAAEYYSDLAGLDWFEELAAYWEEEQELGDLLAGLDEYEAEAFVELLLEYGAEDTKI
ncbi:MAG: hypothetical protein GWP08_18980 [Nitrospiraceae bacterium]|nr:hypothetical protein [Nitrospiraceae bacterium]